jgi:hypothetical protein
MAAGSPQTARSDGKVCHRRRALGRASAIRRGHGETAVWAPGELGTTVQQLRLHVWQWKKGGVAYGGKGAGINTRGVCALSAVDDRPTGVKCGTGIGARRRFLAAAVGQASPRHY